MPDKKNGGGDVEVGDVVLYQPTRLQWLAGGGPQIPALVEAVDEEGENSPATLTVWPRAGIADRLIAVTMGDADGQYMKKGEESKTAKALKQAAEDKQKADEDKAKKDAEEAKKAGEEAKKQKSAGGIPTTQAQLNQDQHMADLQYRYPQPPPQD